MGYRAEATSLEGFVQQLAVGYVSRGYRFYFQGLIPAGKDPRAVDAKLMARYGVVASKFERAWCKARGQANVQYLRYRHHFVLLSTADAQSAPCRSRAAGCARGADQARRLRGFIPGRPCAGPHRA